MAGHEAIDYADTVKALHARLREEVHSGRLEVIF